MKIKELLNNSDKWIKGAYAKTNDNVYIEKSEDWNKDLYSFCLSGALFYCYQNTDSNIYVEVKSKLIDEIRKYTNFKSSSIIGFNDDPNTSFEDIKKVLEMADV